MLLRLGASALHRVHSGLILALALAMVGLVTTGEEFASPHVPLGLFYAVPIALVTWFVGGPWGMVFAAFSGIAAAFFALGYMPDGTSSWVIAWSFVARVSSFATVSGLIWSLHAAIENQRALANTDPMTGIGNARAFRLTAEQELARCARQGAPLTAVYLDCDNFKSVNDRYGHASGDRLLKTVARTLRTHLRLSDHVSRVGGDEFALIVPGAGARDAGPLMTKMQRMLLEEMEKNRWPVTFSIGVATFVVTPRSVDELLAKVDELQYRAKTTGKNRIIYDVIAPVMAVGESAEAA